MIYLLINCCIADSDSVSKQLFISYAYDFGFDLSYSDTCCVYSHMASLCKLNRSKISSIAVLRPNVFNSHKSSREDNKSDSEKDVKNLRNAL